MLVAKDFGAFNQNAGNLGDGGLGVPQKSPLKILLSHGSFKGRQGSHLS